MSEPEMKRLLAWFVAQCEGDSGTGASYWEQFPEFVQAKEITTRDAKVAKELPEGFDALAAAAASETREIQKKISLLCMGRDVRHTFAAMALEISACEGMMDLTPACFDLVLSLMRGAIGKAKAMAEAARRNN